jgi:hypothetical protein
MQEAEFGLVRAAGLPEGVAYSFRESASSAELAIRPIAGETGAVEPPQHLLGSVCQEYETEHDANDGQSDVVAGMDNSAHDFSRFCVSLVYVEE